MPAATLTAVTTLNQASVNGSYRVNQESQRAFYQVGDDPCGICRMG